MNIFERSTQCALAITLAIGVAAGMTFGWHLWRPKKSVNETTAAAIVQNDGSVMLAKQPDASAKPAQSIPQGAVVERVVYVTVQPKPSPGQSGAALPPIPGSGATALQQTPSVGQLCPPVRVDLTLVRMTDGRRRVLASSPDGTVIPGASMDVPVEDAKPAPRELKWAAGAVVGQTSTGDKSIGAIMTRDVSFLRFGAEITKNTYALPQRIAWEGRVSVMIRF